MLCTPHHCTSDRLQERLQTLQTVLESVRKCVNFRQFFGLRKSLAGNRLLRISTPSLMI